VTVQGESVPHPPVYTFHGVHDDAEDQ